VNLVERAGFELHHPEGLPDDCPRTAQELWPADYPHEFDSCDLISPANDVTVFRYAHESIWRDVVFAPRRRF
jgi:hypothetical protein